MNLIFFGLFWIVIYGQTINWTTNWYRPGGSFMYWTSFSGSWPLLSVSHQKQQGAESRGLNNFIVSVERLYA